MLVGPFSLASDGTAAIRDRIRSLGRTLADGRSDAAYRDPRRVADLNAQEAAVRRADGTGLRAERALQRLGAVQAALAKAQDAIQTAAAAAIHEPFSADFERPLRGLLGDLSIPQGADALIGALPPGGLVPSAPDLVVGARAAMAGAADPEAAVQLIADWLRPGGPAEVAGLVQSPAPVVVPGVGPTPLGGSSEAFRDVVGQLVLGIIGTEDADPALIRKAAERLLPGEGIARLQGSVGRLEGMAKDAGEVAASGGDRARLIIARTTEIDPYATATALSDAETQLETLYLLTGRLSRLTLASRL